MKTELLKPNLNFYKLCLQNLKEKQSKGKRLSKEDNELKLELEEYIASEEAKKDGE